jgi:hypothetical protein
MTRVKVVFLAVLVLTLIALGHHQLARISNASLIPAAQAQGTPTPTVTPTPTPTPPPPILGRMTGGGSVFLADGRRVTHGFEIHCGAPPPLPNNLQINWKDPAGNAISFHLENLTLGVCILDPAIKGPKPPVAPFNTFIGAGTGRLNEVAGASISFIFTDQGEPGTSDTVSMIISDAFNNVVLTVPTTALTFGNQQAHNPNP